MRIRNAISLLLVGGARTVDANDSLSSTPNCMDAPPPCTGEEIIVFGHRSPDTDCILSAIIYAWELHNPVHEWQEPLCATAHVNSDNPNRETSFVLDYFNMSTPPILAEITSDVPRFASVDTNNLMEYPDGAEPFVADHLHSIIDNHKLTGTLETTLPIGIDMRADIGSTGCVLFYRSREAGRTIPGEGCPVNIAGLMLATILSDTLNLRSSRATGMDRNAIAYLAPLAGVNDVDGLFDQMMTAKSNIAGMTPLDLVMDDSKLYTFTDPDGESFHLRVSVIEGNNPEELLAMADDIGVACDEQLVIDQQKEPNMRATLFFVIDVVNATATYIPSSSTYARQLVEMGAYPKAADDGQLIEPQENIELVFLDNGQILLDTILSRSQIVPGLTLSSGQVQYTSDNNLLDTILSRSQDSSGFTASSGDKALTEELIKYMLRGGQN